MCVCVWDGMGWDICFNPLGSEEAGMLRERLSATHWLRYAQYSTACTLLSFKVRYRLSCVHLYSVCVCVHVCMCAYACVYACVCVCVASSAK